MVDRTPPLAGMVNDGERVGTDIDYTSSTSMLCVNWQGFSDPESGISSIRWTIGKASCSQTHITFCQIDLFIT